MDRFVSTISFLCLNVFVSHGFILFDNSGNAVNDVVNTACGAIKGHWNESERAFSFSGIPYASPPVGKLRWMPPVPLDPSNGNCWKGQLGARTFGNMCAQPLNNTSQSIGVEDCLFLNVWTPSINQNASLPVMVWVHGGNLIFGSGNGEGYSPSAKLAAETNLVYVSMNYRLNAFGFMALDMLAPLSPTNTSGNYGLMDQIAVLQWVQDNIREFGGDPNKVTIFGQSSGGTAIFALLGSPLVKGLFHKAWIASASPVLNKTASQVYKDNQEFVRNAMCTDVDCLYNLSMSDVISAIPWNEYPAWSMENQAYLPTKGQFYGALAIVDGYVLPEAPFDAWVHGRGQDVPLLIGSTSQETDFNVFGDDPTWTNWTLNTWYEENVRKYLEPFGDVVAETALKLYPRSEKTPEFQLTSMITDVRLTCATDYLSLIASTSFTSPVYRYIATHAPSEIAKVGAHYAFHGIDIAAFFETYDFYFNVTSERDLQFGDTLRAEVMDFINTGVPARSDWKTYPMATALISEVTSVTNGYHTTECEFWLRNGFFSYAWIN